MNAYRATVAVLLAVCTACAPPINRVPSPPIAKQAPSVAASQASAKSVEPAHPTPPASASPRRVFPGWCPEKEIEVKVGLHYSYQSDDAINGAHVQIIVEIKPLKIKESLFWNVGSAFACAAVPFVDGTQLSIACVGDVAWPREAAHLTFEGGTLTAVTSQGNRFQWQFPCGGVPRFVGSP